MRVPLSQSSTWELARHFRCSALCSQPSTSQARFLYGRCLEEKEPKWPSSSLAFHINGIWNCICTLNSIFSNVSWRSRDANEANHAAFVSDCYETWIVDREFHGGRIGAGRNDELRISDVLHVPTGDKTFGFNKWFNKLNYGNLTIYYLWFNKWFLIKPLWVFRFWYATANSIFKMLRKSQRYKLYILQSTIAVCGIK